MPENTPNPLRTIRRAKDVTQTQLAEQVGVDVTTISDLERGKNLNPSWSTVVRLARALDVSPEDLFPVPDAPVAAETSSEATS